MQEISNSEKVLLARNGNRLLTVEQENGVLYDSRVRVKKVTVLSADVLQISSNPVSLLSGPDTGYAHRILGVSEDMTYNGATYAGPASLRVSGQAVTGSFVFNDNGLFKTVGNVNAPFYKSNASVADGGWVTVMPLVLDAASDPITGDSDIDFYVIYQVIPIE